MNALIELKRTGKIDDERQRRWFSSPDIDLIVWYDKGDLMVGFEFYYDKIISEHVLIWQADSGFAHSAVDDGEQKPVLNYKEAPILIPDGQIDLKHIKNLFEESCRQLPADVADMVRQKLMHGPYSGYTDSSNVRA